jgi:hypothetical protein
MRSSFTHYVEAKLALGAVLLVLLFGGACFSLYGQLDASRTLFERYSDARTDHGPAPAAGEIASPEAAAAKALDLVTTHLGLQPTSIG